MANRFNSVIERISNFPGIWIKFLQAKVCRIDIGDAHRFLFLEKQFKYGQHIKFTNNYNMVADPETLEEHGLEVLELAVAFSHYTYECTKGYLLVCDLQGIITKDEKKGRKTLLLTDPAIHCQAHNRFGHTNLKRRGFQGFFETHKCNQYCSALGINGKKMME